MLDLVCLLLVEATQAVLRQGLVRDYTVHEESVGTLRGRLRLEEQIRRHYGQVDVLECRFVFLLNMNRIFERFVTRLLSDVLQSRGVRVMAQQRTPRSSSMRTWARPITWWCPTFCSDGSAGFWLVVVQSTSRMRGARITGKPVDIGQVQRRGDGYRGEDLWPDADDLLASLVGPSR